jgi:hypothetical protein
MAHYKSIKALAISAFISVVAICMNGIAVASEVQTIEDPLKPYTKLLLSPSNEAYLLRAYLKKGQLPSIDLYVIHSYYGDNKRYKTINVRWFDGTIKQPKLDDVDFKVDCSSFSYMRQCRSTNHVSMSISFKSWNALSKWAKENPSGAIDMQLQSEQSGNDFNFSLKSSDVAKFNDALIPYVVAQPTKPRKK